MKAYNCIVILSRWGKEYPAFGLIYIVMMLISASSNCPGAIYYVDVNTGLDSYPGTSDRPFQTIQRARDRIRGTHGNTVLIRSGIYYLSEPIEFGEADSGAPGAENIYMAQSNTKPVICGSKAIPAGELLERSQRAIKEVDLSSYGLPEVSQVFSNGKRLVLARYPNVDPQDDVGGGYLYVADDTPESKVEFKYKIEDDDISDWTNIRDAQVNIFPGPNYWNEVRGVESIIPADRLVILSYPTTYYVKPGNRYFFQGIRVELDFPGEWYWDRSREILYIYPESPLVSSDVITIPLIDNVLVFDGASHIEFKNLTLAECNDKAVKIVNSDFITVDNCIITGSQKEGIFIKDGYDITISDCRIYDTGSHAIYAGNSDCYFQQLKKCRYLLLGNCIHNTGVYDSDLAGGSIYVITVGTTVSHNYIFDTPSEGIRFDGNDNVIEYNYIHNVNQQREDSGAIYQGSRSWIQRGNIIRYNYIHDTGGYGWNGHEWVRPYYTYGIYLDDFSSGTTVYGNAIHHSTLAGIYVHGGRDNVVEFNTIIASSDNEQVQYRAIEHQSLFYDTMWRELQLVKNSEEEWDESEYYRRYPQLHTITVPRPPEEESESTNKFGDNLIVYPDDDMP